MWSKEKAGLTVSNAQRELLLAPSTADGVHVTAAHTAGLDLDVDICMVLELHVNVAYYLEAYHNHRMASACTARFERCMVSD